MEAQIELKCSHCKAHFLKAKREYRRQRKRGQLRFYCSKSCQISLQMKERPRPRLENLVSGNRRDEWTPFRWFLLRARQRKKHDPTNLTVQYLKDLWEEQEGCCPLTGWELILPDSSNGWRDGPTIRSASLDRIDCDRGYLQGNVRFVSVLANLAKGRFSDDQLREFCRAVISNS